ncbi:MAG: hypothetical protein HYV09_04405 [Deltaproteobacteria bacterium]|nr:hypothetical protein [Deltaproteobacteria bacterium]
MQKSMHLLALAAVFALGGAIFAACGGSSDESPSTTCDPATDPSCQPGTEYDATVPTAEVGGPGAYPPGTTVLPDGAVVLPDGAIVGPDALIGCTAGSTQCTNCKDDDGDGLVDWLDPECTGPLDNDEGSFATGIPGDNIDPCKQDCWFDGNSGSGNDGCLFPAQCLVGSKDPRCPYDPKAAADPKLCPPPSDKCVKYCKPLTPKGCDCAGCCQVFDATGKSYTVKLVAGCTSEALGDPTKCPTCTQIPECSNPCGKCDFCLGKLTLPPECYPPPPDAGVDAPPPDAPVEPPGTCPPELTKCSPTTPCPTGLYCLTGCCIKPPA